MGLDMYLTREHYVKNWDFMNSGERTDVTITKGGKPHPSIDPAKVREVIEEVAYWRKANAIHAWFVRNVQGGVDECQRAYVSRDDIVTLVETCERVLADHSLAAELLPSQSGFFFGGTEYDDWYFNSLRETVEMLKPIVEDTENSGYLYYQSSW